MLRLMKTATIIHTRTFKNFGHKPQPVPGVTVLWHGFLTFTFIGLILDWKTFAKFFFGEKHGIEEAPWQSPSNEKGK